MTLKVLELGTAQLLHARHCSAGLPRRAPIIGRRSTWLGRFDSTGGPQWMLQIEGWTEGCRPGQRRMFHGRAAGHGHNGARRCQALSLIIIIIIIIIIITIISIMIIILMIYLFVSEGPRLNNVGGVQMATTLDCDCHMSQQSWWGADGHHSRRSPCALEAI